MAIACDSLIAQVILPVAAMTLLTRDIGFITSRAILMLHSRRLFRRTN